jgi:two-component system, OmpR family, sensor histidine kinase MtrB
MRRAPTLKTRLSVVLVLVATLAAISAACLILLTSTLHRTSERAAVAVDGVRLAEEAQRDLLMHERVSDRLVRDQIAADIRVRLVRARQHAQTTEEIDAVRNVERAVGAYFDAAAEGPSRDDTNDLHEAAYVALVALVAANLAEAADAKDNAASWNALADVIGVGVALVVLATVPALVWWMHARAFRPLFGIARAMQRFARGAQTARAPEEGTLELRQMAARFNEMAETLERQREAQQTLLAGIAHDLRNPLGALRMSTDLLSAKKDLPGERSEKVLAVMKRQIDRLDRMVSDVLETATVEAGRVELKLQANDVRALVLEVAQLFEATSTKHQLRLVVPDEPVWARCDAMRIEQVLGNLVNNAIKYSPDGGAVTIALTTRSNQVVVSVRDEGIGMNDEEVRAAFEPFRRSGGLKNQVPGSGLGLYVVRRLVEAHGGTISIQSERGRGSTFEVQLPPSRAPSSDGDDGPEASGPVKRDEGSSPSGAISESMPVRRDAARARIHAVE